MPTYQYRCTTCGTDLEVVQKFTDTALTECPTCGGSLRKVFNAVGVVFKGSGFYRTDSRSANGNGDSAEKGTKEVAAKDASKNDSGGASEKTKSDSSAGSKESGAKTDSKPATKASASSGSSSTS